MSMGRAGEPHKHKQRASAEMRLARHWQIHQCKQPDTNFVDCSIFLISSTLCCVKSCSTPGGAASAVKRAMLSRSAHSKHAVNTIGHVGGSGRAARLGMPGAACRPMSRE